MHYDSILFDFDGVLADTEPIHHACWREVLAPLGINLDWETYRTRCIGLSDWEIMVMLATEHKPPLDPHLLYATRPVKQRMFAARMVAYPPIREATVDFISSLKKYRLAVVSSSDLSEIEPPLVACGIRPKLDALVTASDVKEPKPSPEPYLLAAHLLNAKSPLVVEDSLAGIASGKAAGFDVLRVESARSMPEALRSWLDRKNGRAPNFR
ncbi:MAG: HAD family phosphatase [Acidobacteriales bacterium]|nr:HAD family phosphatase [Terriglobales bacterium]